MTVQRLISAAALVALSLALQGCLAAAAVGTVAGTAIGVTGAVVGGVAKVGGKAVIPGESAKDREEREYEEWKRSN